MFDCDNQDYGFSVLRVVREFTPGTGGSVAHILELSKGINPYLQEQIIVAPHFSGCEEVYQKFPIPIVWVKPPIICNVGCPAIDDFFYSLYAAKVIAKTVKDYGINIVHFHSSILASFLIPQLRLRNQNLNYVVMAHGWYDKSGRNIGLSYIIEKRLLKSFLPDHYVILDDGTQIIELQKILNQRGVPYEIVYHGIDTKRFSNKPVAGSDQFRVLFPHRPIAVKRPDIAIQIFKEFYLALKDQKICLTFLGAEKSLDLINIARNEGIYSNTHFMGSLSDDALINYINQSSVVIGTSLNSNTGRAIQEAMACAKPVVVFNNGGISNLITHMENGILVEPGDTDGFAKALELLYHNPKLRDELGRKARETIIEKRSWDKRIKKELSVYEQVMSVDG